MVCDYKIQALSKKSWTKFQNEYLPKLVSQISTNQFVCNDINNNCLIWIINQVACSKKILPGVPFKQGIPLADTKLGEKALEILRAASKGQDNYNKWSNPTTYHDLFE
jgi:hypothetical protein